MGLPTIGPVVHPATLLVVGAAGLGLIFGSFTTALSYRLPRAISIADGRSRCSACAQPLPVRDLVPVLSWIVNRGRCSMCGTGVSVRYPLIELIAMSLFVVIVAFRQDPIQIALLIALTPLMLSASIIDLEQRLIPNTLITLMIPLVLVWRWWDGDSFATGLAVGAGVLGCGYVVSLLSQRGAGHPSLVIGGGDVKLLAVAAIALPVAQFLLFLVAAGVLGLAFGALWLWRRGENCFPLAPALMLSLWALMTVPVGF